MTIFIQSLDYNLWDLIVDGPNLPTITLENGNVVSKPRNLYDDNDRSVNAKAKHIIICAINSNDFNRISSCVSAKEMDRLEVTYEGTNQVKEAKVSILVHEYEMFTMNENEDIKSMFSRFTNIINALQALDKTYSNSEMDLLGSLMTHELSMQKKVDDEENEKKKKKIVALKSSQTEDSEDDDDDDDELAFITRRFKKFLTSKKKFGGRPNKKFHQKGEASKLEEIICFECNKPGHYKSDCPRLKKKDFLKKKKKAMIAIWDDSDESSSDEDSKEEVAQIALMALEEEEEEENDEVTYDELVLLVEKYSSTIASLKKKVKSLTNENDELKLAKEETSNEIEVDLLENEIAYLVKENKNLKEEIEALKKTFSRFSNSSEKLENLLGMQRCVFDKAGLGYEEMNNVKLYQTFFDRNEKIEKENIETKKKIMCDYCGKIGHTSFTCFHKKNAMFRKNLIRSCNFCGKHGHTLSQCYHRKNATSKKNVMCTHCGKYGHAFSSCFYRRNIVYKRNVVVSCNVCGNNGHTSTSCFYKQNALNDLNFSRTKRSWVPKGTIFTNPKGPKVCWVPQTKT
ncbi:LOW QUALITY PROTEIN: zf-CCHC domain-containing protein/UBN2 domain-containing protein [Cephalotus follicularis]|uniref:Zf-CCHC domain-containing protein/UBN2 domain-containing protein n=1 Tax=Cephalotus follicularis TaxID=3775 RepID=A0A1Q3CE32_CEPFO|nr:LOW QUALITY PROTEIN: zf-CCHC domain-containing protein/UBN2 domain-containing protein [Cephalotus follicularis]